MVRQLPFLFRLWARYLQIAPRRSSGGAVAGSAAFRIARTLTRVRDRQGGLLTLQHSAAPFALTIDLQDFESFNHTLDLWLQGSDEARLVRTLFAPGHTFLNIGANQGLYSLLAASLGGAQSRVYAFEPQPRAAAAIRSSARANAMSTLTVHEMVVGAVEGTLAFFVPMTGSGVGSRSREHAAQAGLVNSVTLPATSVDAFVLSQTLPRVDLMKIDVEGFEADVLRGALDTLRRLAPIVWLELNPAAQRTAGHTQAECLSLLKSCGYAGFFDVATLWSGAPQSICGDVDVLTNIVAVPQAGLEAFRSLIQPRAVPADVCHQCGGDR